MIQQFFLIILSFQLLQIAFGVVCNNPLASSFPIPLEANSITLGSVPYCKSLQNSDSCCTADVIGKFQDLANTLVNDLTKEVIKRDAFLTNVRKTVLPTLAGKLNRMRALTEISITKIATVTSFDTSVLENYANGLYELSNLLTTDLSRLNANFTVYQQARTNCFNTMVQTQMSVICLVCDPAWATKGVSLTGSTVTLTLSNNLKSRLLDSCYDYLSFSDAQNNIIGINYLSSSLDRINAAFAKIAVDDFSGYPEALYVIKGARYGPTDPQSNAEIPSSMPQNCDMTTCNWIYTDLFLNGMLDDILLVGGGRMSQTVPNRRRLLQQRQDGISMNRDFDFGRLLQANTWDPDSDEAGVTVKFVNDPGNLASSAGMLGIAFGYLLFFIGLLIVV